VTARQLRARLNRLTPPATAVIGQDRDRDRRRREELRGRKLSPTGLIEVESAEFLKLEALFCDEDRDHDRLFELSQKQFYAEIGRDQLTEEEVQELAFGLPELLVAVHTSRQSCSKAGKARIFALVWESSEESRHNGIDRIGWSGADRPLLAMGTRPQGEGSP
jgi:hypothetical protein